eukprot:COSAG06_NODE_57156_length_281_cov_0.994505_1_plen_59_part_10
MGASSCTSNTTRTRTLQPLWARERAHTWHATGGKSNASQTPDCHGVRPQRNRLDDVSAA